LDIPDLVLIASGNINTRDKLKEIGKKGESYDTIINRLLKIMTRNNGIL
jgi:hypothetical protein